MTDISMFGSDASVIASSAVTIGLGVVSLYFKWLISSFKELRLSVAVNADLARRVETNTAVALDRHEDMDQKRHEENLYRFEKISVALARLGSTNGTHK